jgi:uncharacterized membrane protein
VKLDESLPYVTAAVAVCTIALNYWIWNHPRARLKQDLEVLKLATELKLKATSEIRLSAEKAARRVYGVDAVSEAIINSSLLNAGFLVYNAWILVRAIRQHHLHDILIQCAVLSVYVPFALVAVAMWRDYRKLRAIDDRRREIEELLETFDRLMDAENKLVDGFETRHREMRIEAVSLKASPMFDAARVARIEAEIEFFDADIAAARVRVHGDPSQPAIKQGEIPRIRVRVEERVAEIEARRSRLSWSTRFLARTVRGFSTEAPKIVVRQASPALAMPPALERAHVAAPAALPEAPADPPITSP